MLRSLLFILFAFLACSCQSVSHLTESSAGCGYNDDNREWARLSAPPSNADRLTKIIDETVFNPNYFSYNSEEWFALPTGEVMFCKRYIPYDMVLSSEWWEFDGSGENPQLVNHDGIIVVTGEYAPVS